MKIHQSNWDIAPEKEFPGAGNGTIRNKLNRTASPRVMCWKWLSPLALAAVLCSCGNNQLVQQYKTLHEHDSILMAQTQADDSTIKGYVSNLNEIQGNLDEIKTREKILTTAQGQGENNGNNAVADIKAIDNLIINSHKEIAALHARMNKMNKQDAEMNTMLAHMSSELTAKDSEINTLQENLAQTNNSYKAITQQFNDSMTVLEAQDTRVENMTNTMNTVYYAVGTVKELKDNKVIDKSGGFVGIGRNSGLKPDFNTTYFTKTDLTKLNVIPLNAKFKKLLTNHPSDSYKIAGDGKADSLVITNPSSFWSETKYLVVAVK